MSLLVECLFIIKVLVAVAFIASGIICSSQFSTCDISKEIALSFVTGGIAFVVSCLYSFMCLKIWLLRGKNAAIMKIVIWLSFQMVCAIAFFIAALVERNETAGATLSGAAIAIFINYLVSMAEAYAYIPKEQMPEQTFE